MVFINYLKLQIIHTIMLGYTQPNNDVYIFFENNEIERLETEKIQGTYFNLRDPSITCLLEASIDDSINDIIKTLGHKNNDGFMTWLHLQMRTREYHIFRERRSFELHEGFRHICLKDANDLDFSNNLNYEQLKYYSKNTKATPGLEIRK